MTSRVFCTTQSNVNCCLSYGGASPAVRISRVRGRRARNISARSQAPPRPDAQLPAPQQLQSPQSIHDIDNGRVLGFGADLAEDHPGFHDDAYKRRRIWISELAKAHKIGTPIPRVDYLPEEYETWATVWNKLKDLVPRHACREFVQSYESFGFQQDSIPQLQDVHERLQAATGWSVRPVAGLMHPRDFLNGLAFRTFHSTQYIRHHGNPVYTPEPDLVHEILGHVPMLVNPDFCELVEAIGRASLGASEKAIWHLTKVYWYTVEFGVVKQDGDFKAFGAGILSSYGELEWMASGRAEILPLDPYAPQPKMSYKDGFQRRYYCLDSFHQGAQLLKEFSAHLRAHSGELVLPS